ncbi:VOC family protein [Kineococcus rhizosphaerae]|uniref:Catechol-2,3-dioxygenase n=1 Tax=Kineococcus rhizosphaerae TaxID=559628 RepID=A0A2T0R7L0_9ACTN|nr:VOC family protein [Kineococcus rhizosphaerae]PRY17159.1 catechol-2,3-dioxygenase [Kineococcus rhizosphaerae]
MPTAPVELHHVEIGVRDLARSLEFHVDVLGLSPAHQRSWGPREAWLSAGSGLLRLVRVEDGDLGGWTSVNHQAGFRHVGFTVADVDAWAQRLSRSGVEFVIAPMTALGGVRIVFFSDPDGALVELVAGELRHTDVWDADLVAARVTHPVPGDGEDDTPVLDHAATTVRDLDEALSTYADGLGLGRLGQVPHPGDERGYVRSYLAAGPGVLEVFSYAVDPLPAAADVDVHRLGLRVLALTCPDPDAASRVVTGHGGRPSALSGPGRHVVDRDGLTLRFLPAGWSPAVHG